MVFSLIVATACVAVAPQDQGQPSTIGAAQAIDPAILAEYNALRAKTPGTADAHWKLGLWCEQKRLKAEALVEFLEVTRLDPRRESAWKKLGYVKQNGRWM